MSSSASNRMRPPFSGALFYNHLKIRYNYRYECKVIFVTPLGVVGITRDSTVPRLFAYGQNAC